MYCVARFWAEVMGYTIPQQALEADDNESIPIIPANGGVRMWFNRVPEPKAGKNRLHIDINMPDGAEMDRLIALGASAVREIRGDDGVLWWTIMADPEGNEFFAFPPRE